MNNLCKRSLAMFLAAVLSFSMIPCEFGKESKVEAATGIKYVATSYYISDYDKGDVVAPNVPGTYPAAIFVHGWNGADNAKGRTLTVMQDWTDKGLIDPMVVVVPKLVEHQTFVKDGILGNVIKRMDNGSFDNLTGCTVDKNKKYAITGWSMGGAVAVYGGSKCRDKISYVGALSPSQAAHFPNTNYGKDSWMLKDPDTKDLKFSTDKDHCYFLSSGATEEGGDHKAAIDCWYTEFGKAQDFISATWTGRDSHDWQNLFKYELFVFIYKMQKGVYPSDEVMIKAFGDSPAKTIIDSTTVVNKEQFKADIFFTGILKEGNYLYTNISESNVKPHLDGKRYYAFHWKRDGVLMDERNNSHLLVADDVGHYITCEINDLFGSTVGSLSMTTDSVIGGKAHTHSWDEGVVTKAATCTTDGEKTRTCTSCGAKMTEVIKALGHDWDEGKVTTEATTTSEGVKTYTCKRCSETYTEVIPKKEKAKGPTAPKGLSSSWCTAEGKNDGKLLNVTTDMEYSLDTSFPKSKTYTCGDGEVTGLAPGTYFVRYKETETTKAGDYCGVIISVRQNTPEEQKPEEQKPEEQKPEEQKAEDKKTEKKSESNNDNKKNNTKKDTNKDNTTDNKEVNDKNPVLSDDMYVSKEFNISFGKNTLRVRVASVSKDNVKLKVVKVLKNGKKIVIPGKFNSKKYNFKITEIGDKAFFKCKAKSITISKYIRKIGKKAFFGMKKCKSLTIQTKLLKKKNVGKKAFAKMNKKIVVKAYKKKLKSYKKILKKRGISKKTKYKKL